MSFPCTGCGICCTKIAEMKDSRFQKEIDEFPYKSENGRCEKLVGRLCSVYQERPNVCNVEYMSKRYNLDYKEIVDVCNTMIKEKGELQYLIK